MLFDIIEYLPDDIINIIFNKINVFQLIFLNKEYYHKFNYLVDSKINIGRYDSYVRDIVRNDYSFIFENILIRKINFWLLRKNYLYNNVIYNDFLDFLLFYCKNNNSNKCSHLIYLQLDLSGLKKKRPKNNRIKYNRWSN
tara:strand:+ start:3026 stop:3445 length:420 start_codon:yes stop_codon:yes gene_type:complete